MTGGAPPGVVTYWCERTWSGPSDDVQPGVVIEITGDHGTLIFGGGVFPGVKEGGAWSFSWDEKTASTDGRSFEQDYNFDRQSDSVSKTTIDPAPVSASVALRALARKGAAS